ANNFSKWCDAGYDKLVKDAKRTTDQGKRTELYKQAQHILKEQVPITPVAHPTVYQPMHKTVRDNTVSPLDFNR
ncbi:ABC transporter substrate-binding protein, partial [Klebsiella pneumoniae]